MLNLELTLAHIKNFYPKWDTQIQSSQYSHAAKKRTESKHTASKKMDPRSKCTIQVTEFVYFVNLALSKIIENIQFYRTEKLLLENVDV